MSDKCFLFFFSPRVEQSSASMTNMALLFSPDLGSVHRNDLGSQPILTVSVNRDNAQLGMVVC